MAGWVMVDVSAYSKVLEVMPDRSVWYLHVLHGYNPLALPRPEAYRVVAVELDRLAILGGKLHRAGVYDDVLYVSAITSRFA